MGINDTLPSPSSLSPRHRRHTHHTDSCFSDKLLLSLRIPNIPTRVLEKIYRGRKQDWRIVLPTPKRESVEMPDQREVKRRVMHTESRSEIRNLPVSRPSTFHNKDTTVPQTARQCITPMISFTSVIRAADHLRSQQRKTSFLRKSLNLHTEKCTEMQFPSKPQVEKAEKKAKRPSTAKATCPSFTFNEHFRVSVPLPLPTPSLGATLCRLPA